MCHLTDSIMLYVFLSKTESVFVNTAARYFLDATVWFVTEMQSQDMMGKNKKNVKIQRLVMYNGWMGNK